MSSPHPDYYKILGLPTSATADDIKRRYRELARRYHPDVNPSAEAAQQIKVINEAYHHLGDSDRRALYDAERILYTPTTRTVRASRPSPSAAHPGTTSAAGRSGRTGGTAAGHHSAGGQRTGFNGFGRVPVDNPDSNESAYAANSGVGTGHRTDPLSAVDRMVVDAQLAFIMHRYGEAERLCRQALAQDQRQAVAHEILGDIYRQRGDRVRAMTAYSYAVQFNPRNQNAQIKLERLSGIQYSGRSRGPTVTHQVKQSAIQKWLRGPNRESVLAIMSLAAVASLGGVLLLFNFFPGGRLIGEFSANLIIALAAVGLLLGAVLALYGGLRPMSHELTVRTQAQRRWGLSLFLAACSLVSFYFSLLIYLFLSVIYRRVSTSVLQAYGATMIFIVLFYCLYRPTDMNGLSTQTLLYSGNLLFPCILAGWRIGDWLRLTR